MEEPPEKTGEAPRDLETSVREHQAVENLFQEKVLAIGRLHTQRALLANQIGALKSESVMQADRFGTQRKEELLKIESTMRTISGEITGFSPAGTGELRAFESEIGSRLQAVEKALAELEGAGSTDE